MGLGHDGDGRRVGRGGQGRASGPFVLNCQAPDEGNMHTLLHWATDEQKEKYLRPLCEGTARSCFAMTEPEVAGSDPTLIQTHAYQDGDEWVINGHKWFISSAQRRQLRHPHRPHRGRPRDRRRRPTRRSSSTCPSDGWTERARDRDDARRAPATARSCIEDLRVPDDQHARRPGPGPPARPVPARPGPPRPLHALDRPGRDGARHDGRPLARTGSPTARCSPRSRASSG